MKAVKIPTANKALDMLLERLDAAEAKKEEKEEKERKWTPEQWYQELKKRWYFHNTSWYMRLKEGYDGKGCTPWNGCITVCAFYEDEGKLEEKEIQEAIHGLATHPSIKILPHDHKPNEPVEPKPAAAQEQKKKNKTAHVVSSSTSTRKEMTSSSKLLSSAEIEEEKKRKQQEFFDQFKDCEFWIWNPHLHLLKFLLTQGKCCFNHMIGEPEKWGKPMPIL